MSRNHSPTATPQRGHSPCRKSACGAGGPFHPDHHLWRNGRLWWAAFTVHRSDWTAERVRRSLGTADLAEARRRRDALLAACAAEPGCELSLRFVPARIDQPDDTAEITP